MQQLCVLLRRQDSTLRASLPGRRHQLHDLTAPVSARRTHRDALEFVRADHIGSAAQCKLEAAIVICGQVERHPPRREFDMNDAWRIDVDPDRFDIVEPKLGE